MKESRYSETQIVEILKEVKTGKFVDVREITDNGNREYNDEKPHDSLGDLAPGEYLTAYYPTENSNLQLN